MNEVELHLLEEKFRHGFYGMLFFLVLFTLIQYWQQQRKPFYIYYAFYTLGILFAFEPHFTPVKNAFVHLIEWPTVLFYYLFINAFLELSRHSKRFSRFINYYRKGFLGVFILQTLLVFSKERGWYYDPLEWLTETMNYAFFTLSVAVSFYVMWQVYRLRSISSRYVLIGMFLLTIGMMTNQLFFPIFSVYVIWFTIIMELILFALAIGYKTKRMEIEKREAQEELMKATLTTLQEQMNPLFFLNSLAFVQDLIQQKEDEKAIDFLTRLSKLQRLIVDHFRRQKVPISKELEICRLYLEMERMRCRARFHYQVDIHVDENLLSFVEVPPLLFQPLLEHSIWQSLLQRSEEGVLYFSIETKDDFLFCVIEDNGIGRIQNYVPTSLNKGNWAPEIFAKVRKKINLFEKLYQVPIKMEIIDKLDSEDKPGGLKVTFLIGI